MRTKIDLIIIGAVGTLLVEGMSYIIYRYGYSRGAKEASNNDEE